MKVTYKSKKLEKICTDKQRSIKKYGLRFTEVLLYRLLQMRTFQTVELMVQLKVGRCHLLKNNRKGQYAVDLIHPYRLVFEIEKDEIQIAQIIEIVDYHK